MSVDLYIEKTVAHAKLVVVRMMGGAGYWPYGLDRLRALARGGGPRLIVVPGDDHWDAGLELASMASLEIGSASFYQEVLHPVAGVDPATGGARVGHITINATGNLEDGTPFRFHASGGGELFPGPLAVHEVDIRFR